MNYLVYGDLIYDKSTIDERTALTVVWLGRHGRLARVHRTGRRGERRWVLEPRNVQEQFKQRSLLK